jgi:uncharacterized protein (TIGR02145 family)
MNGLKIICILIVISLASQGCKKEDSATWQCGDVITDVDGNAYNTLNIGGQCWMQENLNVSSGIQEVTDSSEWRTLWESGLETAASCYYPGEGSSYGRLYNWYAVMNSTLCPEGWHIPTDDEWQELIDFLGGDTIAGPAIRTNSSLWNSFTSVTNTNSSGFSALPGGAREPEGYFIDINNYAGFWSSTESSDTHAFLRYVIYNYNPAVKWTTPKHTGLSCRCIED